ncbi:hypothetical protein Acr_04g0006610 [Actinidia rufa]|uniref:Uncharacterized protein n=1 Tax=Actinidia rufa TaxID=165716 RepID=A0A7J0EHF8_9ERIC|nr:hypothetical protein Acr_04g0006610 [Actinidia rufa]
MAGSSLSTSDASIWAWEMLEGTLSCKSPFVHWHPLVLSPAITSRPSFQCSYCFELAKHQRLGGNDGLSSEVVTAPSSGIEGSPSSLLGDDWS